MWLENIWRLWSSCNVIYSHWGKKKKLRAHHLHQLRRREYVPCWKQLYGVHCHLRLVLHLRGLYVVRDDVTVAGIFWYHVYHAWLNMASKTGHTDSALSPSSRSSGRLTGHNCVKSWYAEFWSNISHSILGPLFSLRAHWSFCTTELVPWVPSSTFIWSFLMLLLMKNTSIYRTNLWSTQVKTLTMRIGSSLDLILVVSGCARRSYRYPSPTYYWAGLTLWIFCNSTYFCCRLKRHFNELGYLQALAGVCHVCSNSDLEPWTWHHQWYLRLPWMVFKAHFRCAFATRRCREYQTSNLGPLTIITPGIIDVLGDALLLPFRCGFTGGCISAAFMTRNT